MSAQRRVVTVKKEDQEFKLPPVGDGYKGEVKSVEWPEPDESTNFLEQITMKVALRNGSTNESYTLTHRVKMPVPPTRPGQYKTGTEVTTPKSWNEVKELFAWAGITLPKRGPKGEAAFDPDKTVKARSKLFTPLT